MCFCTKLYYKTCHKNHPTPCTCVCVHEITKVDCCTKLYTYKIKIYTQLQCCIDICTYQFTHFLYSCCHKVSSLKHYIVSIHYYCFACTPLIYCGNFYRVSKLDLSYMHIIPHIYITVTCAGGYNLFPLHIPLHALL